MERGAICGQLGPARPDDLCDIRRTVSGDNRTLSLHDYAQEYVSSKRLIRPRKLSGENLPCDNAEAVHVACVAVALGL